MSYPNPSTAFRFYPRTRCRGSLAATVVLAACLAAATAAGQDLVGPVYPAPGGSNVSFSGRIGATGGMDVEYSDFDLSQVLALYWGPWDGDAVEVAFDGAVDAAGETLQFASGSSNLAVGVARWEGTADLTYWAGSGWAVAAVPTRFTITATAGGTPIAMTAASAFGFPECGAFTQVTGAYELNLLAEGYWASQWEPVAELFDSLNTPQGHQVITNLYDGFFYEPKPLFTCGFETGDCSQWSNAVGLVP